MLDKSEWEYIPPSKKQKEPAFDPSEWQPVNKSLPSSSEPESLGKAALLAIPRIGEDLIKGAYGVAQNIPGYWQKAKTEVPGFINPINAIQHPMRRAGQTLAGLLEAGQSLNRLPRNIAEYAENRLNLLPQGASQKVPVAPDITGAIQHDLGDPQYPGEALARGIGKNALNLATGASVINRLPHLTKSGASKKLRQVEQRMNEKNVGPLNIDPQLIEDMRQFLPNTQAYRDALDAAHTGNFKKLFNLQSDVGKESAAKAKDWFSSAQRSHGRAGLKSVNALLDAMHAELKGKGMLKESELLRQGRNDYRRYKKFAPYKYMLGGAAATAAIPRNHLTQLLSKIASHGIK